MLAGSHTGGLGINMEVQHIYGGTGKIGGSSVTVELNAIGITSELNAAELDPVLLILTTPWFQVHTGHIRAWTVMHRLQYPCLLARLNMRMLVLVQPGELQGCARICATWSQ